MERDPNLTFQREEREKIGDDVHTYTQKVLQMPVQHDGFTVVHKEERQHSIFTPAPSLTAAPTNDLQVVAQEVAVRYEGLVVHMEWCTSYQQESDHGRIPPVHHTWRNHMTLDFAHLLATGQGNPVERVNALHTVALIDLQRPSHSPAARVSWSSSAVVETAQNARAPIYVMPKPIKSEAEEEEEPQPRQQQDAPVHRQQYPPQHPTSRPPLRIPGNPPPARSSYVDPQIARPPRFRPPPRNNTIHSSREDIISIASDSDEESVLGSIGGGNRGRGGGVGAVGGGGSAIRGGGGGGRRGAADNDDDDREDLAGALRDVKVHYQALKQLQTQQQRGRGSGSGSGRAGMRGAL